MGKYNNVPKNKTANGESIKDENIANMQILMKKQNKPVFAFVVSKLEKCRPVQTKTVFYQRSIGQPGKVPSVSVVCDIVLSVLIDVIRLQYVSRTIFYV